MLLSVYKIESGQNGAVDWTKYTYRLKISTCAKYMHHNIYKYNAVDKNNNKVTVFIKDNNTLKINNYIDITTYYKAEYIDLYKNYTISNDGVIDVKVLSIVNNKLV